jgi:zinc protease
MSSRAQPPTLPAPVAPHLPDMQRHVLANGLECFIVPQHAVPILDVRLIVRGGAQLDTPPRAGRSRLLAELLDQGTASRTATDIADQAEQLGASLETRATWDAFAIALHVLAPRLRPAFDLLADIARNPSFPLPELQRKRTERLAAILQERNEPRIVASNAFSRFAYPADHPFSAPPGGTRDSVDALSHGDITDLYANSFAPRHAALILCGDIDVLDALALAEERFGDWAPQAAADPGALDEMVPQSARSVHIVDRPGAPQSELRVGLAGPRRSTPDYFPLLVANTVLGGAFTSRLNMRLREEKAYTYGAGSQFAFRAAGGPFVAATAVATAATADAIAVIVQELERMVAERVPAVELERAREYLVLGLARTFETTADIAQHVGELALYGLDPGWYDGYADAVRAVTASDVQRACARWLDTQLLTVAVAGDARQVRGEIEGLKLGAVHVHESV